MFPPSSNHKSCNQYQHYLTQFLQYGLVGIANTVLHGIVFALLVTSGIEQSYSNF